jgi:hypothetical protein
LGEESLNINRTHKTFRTSLLNIELSQKNVLERILSENKNTQYGKKYNFTLIYSVSLYQELVPITKYSDYKKYIDDIKKGKQNVLTKDKVLLLGFSGGSTSANKLIPYTKSLKEEFLQGITPWLTDIFANYPQLKDAKAYWSITPAAQNKRKIKSSVPVGFENDLEYFPPQLATQIAKNLFMPPAVSEIETTEAFLYITSLFLAQEEDLAFISVWNPAFLVTLLENIQANRDKIAEDIKNGSINKEIKLPLLLKHKLEKYIKKGKVLNFNILWPKLKFISCWADGNSKPYAKKLAKILGHVYMQPKGLLATEGIMTIPFEGIGCVPCVNSHFFEFIEQNAAKKVKLLHELEVGKKYSVLLTTSGGFYRYEIEDIIKVIKKYKTIPVIEFVGKKNNVSDYFGEKLNEQFVKNFFNKLNLNSAFSFFMLAPVKTEKSFYYTLYLELKDKTADKDLRLLENNLEKELAASFHYKYCRKLKQLEKVKIFIIKETRGASAKYLKLCSKKQKLGDIKPLYLSNKTNWNFNGHYL